MLGPKRVLCLMDLSVVGRAGCGVAPVVLGACGVQGCCLPTSLLSTHLGGFGDVVALETEEFCRTALGHFVREGIGFDAIMTGYLTREAEFRLAHMAHDLWPGALLVCDPVMADNGKLYSKTTQDAVRLMRELTAYADVITPNVTECALLDDSWPALPATREEASALIDRIRQMGRVTVATSIPATEGYTAIAVEGCGEETEYFEQPAVPAAYPGTGDLFSAAFVGLALSGHPLPKAAALAARFTGLCVKDTYEGSGEARHGVWFEPRLHLLHTLSNGGDESCLR